MVWNISHAYLLVLKNEKYTVVFKQSSNQDQRLPGIFIWPGRTRQQTGLQIWTNAVRVEHEECWSTGDAVNHSFVQIFGCQQVGKNQTIKYPYLVSDKEFICKPN